ncbi:AAA family ATPase [Schnuerera sp. xch1]|uniref:ATP-binding protein n=1 Tax=Schnuerera sp. xch1 TaxID=2874283 RepID=UPI001CBB06F2|nr:AAA family ATPase [Schnuerera sp. xch1]MBZ2174560.1 AAA family ATPase [Schnuerera sp. xch1]
MILNELNLVSFGKFHNKTFELEDGLNIIYGKNESGKTTIYNFINGMFYGFLKPYVTRRYFFDELDKYRPWHGQEYSGVMSISKDDKKYRIERDFNKGEVNVYDDLTGKNITDYIDTGKKLKENLPGLYFFDFNSTVYNNTISIKQLGNKVDSNFSKEVKDKLANISMSLDDEISIRNTLDDLDKQLETIGTKKAYKRSYGKAVKKLERLEERREQLLERQKEYDQSINEFLDLKEEIEDRENIILQLKAKFNKAKILAKKKMYQDALNIKNEIKEIDDKIVNLKQYSNISSEDYYLSLKLDSEKNNLDREIHDLSTRIKDIDAKLKDLELKRNNGIISGVKADELYTDMSDYNQMEEEKNKLVINSQQNKLEILNSELKGAKDKLHRSKTQSIIFLISTMASIGLIIVNNLFSILTVISGMVSIYLFSSSKKFHKEAEDFNKKITNLNSQEEERIKKIKDIERNQNKIIKQHNCSSKAELVKLYEDIRFTQANQNDRLMQIRELNRNKKKYNSLLETKVKDNNDIDKKLKNIITRNNSNNLDEFKEGLNNKAIYDNLINDKKNKMELLNRILADTSLEKLKAELKDYDDKYFEYVEQIDLNEVAKEIDSRKRMLSSMKDTCSKLEERIENLNKYVKELVDIEEKITRTKTQLNTMDDRIKSIQIAKEVIENISQEIHNQFAPKINKDVSRLIELVTAGKYDRIKIDDDLKITVENPNTKETIEIDSLSGGTIDQMYFALRFSIMDSMKKERLPLILDDCFIQYDDYRLKNILEFLRRISDKVQILLFTCHHREMEILDNLGLKYNLIDLG